MANQFTAALAELAAVQAAEFGTACEVTIGEQTVACLLMENPLNSVIVEGGTSEGGSQTVVVSKALLTSFSAEPKGWPPINDTAVVLSGVNLFVLHVTERLGVLYIDVGLPSSDPD